MISPEEKNIAIVDSGTSVSATGETPEVRVRDYAYQVVGSPDEEELEGTPRREAVDRV